MPVRDNAIIIVLVMILVLSCNIISLPERPIAEITPAREVVTAFFIPSPTAPALTPTLLPTPTYTQPPTEIPSPTTSPTRIPKDIAPFHFVTSLEGLPVDSTGNVEVYAPADGSVWMITSQSAIRWDGQAWEVVLADGEGFLASVDDGGCLWLLPQDTNEISAWRDGQWTSYGADSGWVSVGTFEQSWWATTPWGVYTDASGTTWLPMERDVRAFDGVRWKVYPLEEMGFPIQETEDISLVHYLATLKDSVEIWVGECYYSGPGPMGGGGVRWFDGHTWQGEGAPVGSICGSALAVDAQGDVWLGVSDSIWQYEHTSQSWAENRLPETLLLDFNFTHPIQLIVDQAGDVWVIEQMCGGASCDGPVNLYRIHNGEWSWVTGADYWSSSFKQLVLDGNGQGWLFWDGMFYQLGDHPLDVITSIDARGVDVSPDGNIWAAVGFGDYASLQVLKP
jgi:hypothetical protein